jgi:putative oxygen-independent coproporphyrinogen III oxidase
MAAEEHEGPFAALPAGALAELASRTFGIYVHVPFCASRCGYCAFTTYTAADLGGDALRRGYPAAAAAEVALAARTLGDPVPEVRTVFFGGGTPTLLDPAELLSILDAVRQHFPVAADVEVTVEANPDSVDRGALAVLRAGGVTRVSFGMQSVRSHVLAVLERSHTPGAAARAVADAHAAGFDHISLDLIYGTPGETDDDWRASLGAALAAGPDHVSAYALTIEPRTRLAAHVRSGRLPEPDEDALVRRYALADDLLTAAGYRWYELSNWARDRDARCRHNLGYWLDANWWGIGPGAHSHVAGVRWWNVPQPGAHADAVARGALPIAGHELVDTRSREIERVLLGIRLADGVRLVAPPGFVEGLVTDDLLEVLSWEDAPVVALSRRGRSLADLVARRVIEAGCAGPAFFAPVTRS